MARPSTTDKAQNDSDHVSAPPVSELKFEAAVAELEQIVQNMERGQLPLEESISAYRRGSELLMHCQQLLSDAERKIQILENGTLRDVEFNNGESL